MVDLGPVGPIDPPFTVCLHKDGLFADVTWLCDARRIYLHIDLDCNGVRREQDDGVLRRSAGGYRHYPDQRSGR